MLTTTVVFPKKDVVEVRQVETDEVKPGQIMIETERSLVSTGTELRCLQRGFSAAAPQWAEWVSYPFNTGYCAAGTVIETGKDVTRFKVGDRVAGFGAHRRHTVFDESYAAKVPDDLSFDEAAWFPLGAIVQYGYRLSRPVLGETIVVVGLGNLGQLCARYARLGGAGEVIAIDPSPTRLKFVENIATQCLSCGVEEAVDAVNEMTGGKMAEVLYEVTGHPPVFGPCQLLLALNGRMVTLGDTGHPEQQSNTPLLSLRNLTVIGVNPEVTAALSDWPHPRSGDTLFKFIQRGQMNVKELITHHFPVEKAPEVYDMLLRDRQSTMGVLFTYENV